MPSNSKTEKEFRIAHGRLTQAKMGGNAAEIKKAEERMKKAEDELNRKED